MVHEHAMWEYLLSTIPSDITLSAKRAVSVSHLQRHLQKFSTFGICLSMSVEQIAASKEGKAQRDIRNSLIDLS
jgi:hypothetical protein